MQRKRIPGWARALALLVGIPATVEAIGTIGLFVVLLVKGMIFQAVAVLVIGGVIFVILVGVLYLIFLASKK